jgi:hypothetical protein
VPKGEGKIRTTTCSWFDKLTMTRAFLRMEGGSPAARNSYLATHTLYKKAALFPGQHASGFIAMLIA